MQTDNPFITFLKETHFNYLSILAQNENYILAVPPGRLLPQELDERVILAHIL